MQYYTKKIAEHYGKDCFNLLEDSQKLVHNQLVDVLKLQNGHCRIDKLLDVAVGLGGAFVHADKHFEVKQFIGNDYSLEMLKRAKTVFPNFDAMHANCVDIDKHLPKESVDVVYAHYVLSYVNTVSLLRAINNVLKNRGYLSIATSTWDNLRDLQELVEKEAPLLFNRDKYIGRDKGSIPLDKDHLINLLQQAGFEILSVGAVQKKISMRSFDEFWLYFAESGWYLQAARITGSLFFDKWLWRAKLALLTLFSKNLKFPLRCTTDLCVITARKIS